MYRNRCDTWHDTLSIPLGSAWSTRRPGEAVGLRFVEIQTTATMPQSTLALQLSSKSLPRSANWQAKLSRSTDLDITINSSHLELRFPNGELPGPTVQLNVQAHRKVGAQWVVAPLEPVRASTFFFHDSPPLLTCVFHQTRRNFEPGSDPGSIYTAPANDVDQTPSASVLALCPTTHGGSAAR